MPDSEGAGWRGVVVLILEKGPLTFFELLAKMIRKHHLQPYRLLKASIILTDVLDPCNLFHFRCPRESI